MSISGVLSGAAFWPYLLMVLGVLVLALLYGLGARRLQGYGQSQRLHPWNYLAFAAGLLVVLAALHPALYGQAHRLLWAHMVQNEALAVPGAMLVMLGMPLWAFW